MLSARWLRLGPPPPARPRARRSLERVVDWFYRPIERVYMTMLAGSMRHRWVVVLAVVGDARLVRAAGQGGAQGLPAQERRGAVRDQRARARGDEPGRDRDRRRAHRARGPRAGPGWRRTLVTIGDNEQQTPNLAAIYVRLLPPDKRTATQDQMQDKVGARSSPSCRRSSGSASRRWRRSAPARQHRDGAVHPDRARPRPAHRVHRPRSSRS